MPIRSVILVGALLTLGSQGCGLSTIRYRGLAPLNENHLHKDTPVRVRVFMLADDRKFMEADYDRLWVDPHATLGRDLLDDDYLEFPVEAGDHPDEHRTAQLSHLPEGVHHLGIMGMFRKKGDGRRRVAATLEEASFYVFEFTGYQVRIDRR